jgi:carboxyl-terminal processing protease
MNRKKFFLVGFLLALAILGALSYFLFFSHPAQPEQNSAKADDFSSLSWTKAFDGLYGRMSKEYAFTEWKGVDWQRLYDEYAPRIGEAETNNDFDAYYVALRAYLTEIPDGHVSMTSLHDIDEKYIGGGFGVAAAKLGSGSVIIAWVDETSPAYRAGIRAGASLLSWNGQPIAEALTNVSTIFGGTSATTENLEAKQVQYLARAPIDTQAQVEFQNVGEQPQMVTLTAYDDNRLSLKRCYPDAVLSDKVRSLLQNAENDDPVPESMVETKALGDGTYYIKIWGEFDADLQQTGSAPSTLKLFQDALKEANEAGAASLILDIRNNLGGLDDMAAQMLGSFYTEKTLYEYQNVYNAATGKRELQKAGDADGLYIEPSEPHFDGKVICLINQKCVSSGEGIAKGIRELANGETLGLYGTNGSFGLTGTEISMPGGLTVRYPNGQSLDKNHEIQLDSRGGVGGVLPTIRIEMTAENAVRIANGEDVELEEAVRILKGASK